MKRLTAVVLLSLGVGSSVAAAPQPEAHDLAKLESLSILPKQVTLTGTDSAQQLLVTGLTADGGLRDVTASARFQVSDPRVVCVREGGVIIPLANGTTIVTADVEGKSVVCSVTVQGMERDQPINFANDIVPLFTKAGCNTGECHGKSGGQNGFRLSLLGFEPRVDYEAIVRESRGRRIFLAAPEHSLLLRKPTGVLPHGGAKRVEPGSPEYRLLVRWIRSGAPFGRASDPHVVRITLAPEHRVMGRNGQQQLQVTAHFSDGSSQDVTHRAEYFSNDEALTAAGKTGLIQTFDVPGEASVMVRYLGHVSLFRATVPTGATLPPFPPPSNFIDQRVFAKLQQLGIPPSDLCTDSEFLRRSAIDITGTLPTPTEVERFLADRDPGKRDRWVDELLNRPAYASYFALKWGDILKNRWGTISGNPKTSMAVAAARTASFHSWIRDGLRDNKPYDRFVRELLTARGETAGPDATPPIAWYTQVRTAQDVADDVAQVFLGTQIQCAQCHHHPYEKWSQDDYWGLAAFFGRLSWNQLNGRSASGDLRHVVHKLEVQPRGQVRSPQGKTYARPRALDAAELDIAAGEDPRQQLAEWMVQPDNPYFARALVNRYWAHFLGRGIVDPPDDMRITNPPSNPELLDALARDFVEHRFDLKHLVRTICTSRTYQLSGLPNAHNANDAQNFSRHLPRRLAAEVLLDALNQTTGTTTRFQLREKQDREDLPPGTRAIELPDASVISACLATFEKPKRDTASESERSATPTLAQSLYLANSREIQQKLADGDGRVARLAADPQPDAAKLRELYLWCFARPPSADELKVATAYLARKATTEQGKRRAYEDLTWALLNTKEFLFNH
jgi:hypothetical protein